MECHMITMWLMLLPLFSFFVADVICHWWLMELPHLCDVVDVMTTRQMLKPWVEWVGRCYNQHGRCYSLGLVYFNLSSVMLFRTSPHICGRWYLPMFLFRDGLLTLMNIASLISLVRFCSSLPTILKLSSVML